MVPKRSLGKSLNILSVARIPIIAALDIDGTIYCITVILVLQQAVVTTRRTTVAHDIDCTISSINNTSSSNDTCIIGNTNKIGSISVLVNDVHTSISVPPSSLFAQPVRYDDNNDIIDSFSASFLDIVTTNENDSSITITNNVDTNDSTVSDYDSCLIVTNNFDTNACFSIIIVSSDDDTNGSAVNGYDSSVIVTRNLDPNDCIIATSNSSIDTLSDVNSNNTVIDYDRSNIGRSNFDINICSIVTSNSNNTVNDNDSSIIVTSKVDTSSTTSADCYYCYGMFYGRNVNCHYCNELLSSIDNSNNNWSRERRTRPHQQQENTSSIRHGYEYYFTSIVNSTSIVSNINCCYVLPLSLPLSRRTFTGTIVYINNKKIDCHHCHGLFSSLPSTRPNISGFIVGNNDYFYINNNNNIDLRYCYGLSLPSTYPNFSAIIVGHNNWYCYGLSLSSPSSRRNAGGFIVGIINDKNIDHHYCYKLLLSDLLTTASMLLLLLSLIINTLNNVSETQLDDINGSLSKLFCFLSTIGTVYCMSGINIVSDNNNDNNEKKDGSALPLSSLSIINQDNTFKAVILFGFLPSLLFQVWICIYVFAILYNILDPCLVSSDDTFLSSMSSSFMLLFSQVWIYVYVIAILHNILDPCLVSRGGIFPSSILLSTLYLIFSVRKCFHVVAILHNMLRHLLYQASFELFSFASLSCNPYSGSRWCIQRLQPGVTEIPKQCILIL